MKMILYISRVVSLKKKKTHPTNETPVVNGLIATPCKRTKLARLPHRRVRAGSESLSPAVNDDEG